MKFLLCLWLTALTATAAELPGWKLVWSDEFNQPGLPDATKWDYATFDKKPADTLAEWPFNKPIYLILNLAIGGNWGGQKGIDEGAFPQRMEVDYVRVYQKLP